MTEANAEENSSRESSRKRKHMVFVLGADRFAIPLSQVKEVIGLTKITAVPDVPAYFCGLINLRGKIISTIDLRERLRASRTSAVQRPCIIISEIDGFLLGMVVDEILEVVGLEENQIERKLDISSPVSRDYILGAAKLGDVPLTLILDMAKVLGIDELTRMKQAADKVA